MRDEEGRDWTAETRTVTDIPSLNNQGLMDNIERGLKQSHAKGRAFDALAELRERIKHLESQSRAYAQDHRDDHYDGLA